MVVVFLLLRQQHAQQQQMRRPRTAPPMATMTKMENIILRPKTLKVPVDAAVGLEEAVDAGSKTLTCACQTATDVAAVAVAVRIKLSVFHRHVVVTVVAADTERSEAVLNPHATSRYGSPEVNL